MPLIVFVVLAIIFAVFFGVSTHSRGKLEDENIALREEKLRLEERNESLDRQNQLMERQYNLFATKPVITYLNEEQFSSLARVLASTIIAITKQTN